MEKQNQTNKTLAGAPQEVFDYIELCSIKTAAKKLDEIFGLGLLDLGEASQWAEYRDGMRNMKSSLKWLLKQHNIEEYRPLNESDFFKSVEIYRSFVEQLFLDEVAAKLKYNPEHEAKLKSRVEDIWGRVWTQNELDAFKHWLWLVKRNIMSKPVGHRVWLNIFGVSGAGKTEFIKRLLEPLGQKLVGTYDVESLFDRTRWMSLSKNRVVVLNELAYLSKADNDALKMLIDSPIIEFRPLYARQTVSVTNRVTYISSSNNSFEVLLTDPTSARRFYEIKVENKMNWDVINFMDFKELWQGVDENNEKGYYTAAIHHEQTERFKAEDPIEIWLNSMVCAVGEGEVPKGWEVEEKTFRMLYNSYTEWCAENGFKPINSFWLGRKIKQYNHCEEFRTKASRLYKPARGFRWR